MFFTFDKKKIKVLTKRLVDILNENWEKERER